ncbi:PRP40 pre-mRNA processing factor 40 [Mortierella sp. NVP85]|nr:PRP40 pre-mRNA processing factor 40 [Mortierella sp. NVP85]
MDPQTGKSLWVEYTHQDGRKYYYHSVTKQTVWQKPDELKSPKEIALETSPWKEYTTSEGKKYYHNASTKETVWTVPEEYKILLDQLAEETRAKEAAAGPTQPVAPTLPAGATATSPQTPVKPLTPTSSSVVSTPSPLRHQALPPSGAQSQPSAPPLPPQPIASIGVPGSDPLRSSAPGFMPPMNPSSRPPFSHQQGSRPPRFQQSFVSDNSSGGERHHHRGNRDRNLDETPEFSTKEEAEEAFKNLLKETGVTSTWTWEQTMRAVVSNPMYRALKTVAERKSAFQDYVDERRVQERIEERARQQRLKQDFLELLQKSDIVTHTSRYSTISRLFAEEPAFQAIEDDRQRFAIFDSYLNDLIRQEKEEARQKRKSGMAALTSLLQSMDEITLMTRWAEARELLQENKEYNESETIQGLSKMDQLSVYEDHIKHLEREYDHRRARERVLRKRTERKRREAFKDLLADLKKKGSLNAKTSWMQIHPLIKEDPRYLDILGQPGSTPMELFWDLIENLDEKLYQDRKMIQELLKHNSYEVHPETTFDEFNETVSKLEKAAHIPNEDRKLIFDQLMSKAVHYAKEEKRRQEKLARKKAEAFRSMLKALTPSVTVESTWDDVKAKAEPTPEYAALETDEKRKEVFDRYIERLKERITRNYDSDDEDGSILEDDADYYGKRSSLDRKRSAPGSSSSSKYHSSSSSHHHGSSSYTSGGDHHHHRRSTTTRDHSPSKGSHQNGTHTPAGTASAEAGADDDTSLHPSKKMKTSTEEDNSASAQAISKDDSALTGGEEEGEVIETPGAQ